MQRSGKFVFLVRLEGQYADWEFWNTDKELIHPALDISVLINNLKTASARRTRNRFAEHLTQFYDAKPLFWHRTYFVGSVGGAVLKTVRAYVDAQGTAAHARKSEAKNKVKNQTVRYHSATGALAP